MNRIRMECLYCGKRWDIEQGYGWRSHAEQCIKCGEKKMLKKKEETLETGDVFGYRFSPPFPPKQSSDPYPFARYSD